MYAKLLRRIQIHILGVKGLKGVIPAGAEPLAAEAIPEYIPLNPPALTKPSADCSLVLRVSNGNKITSTAVPATPPAYKIKRRNCAIFFFFYIRERGGGVTL